MYDSRTAGSQIRDSRNGDMFRYSTFENDPDQKTAAAPPVRDRRIDVLRGIAVLGIAANHIVPDSAGVTE